MFVTRAAVKRGSVRGIPGQPMSTSDCVLSGTVSLRRSVAAIATSGTSRATRAPAGRQPPNDFVAASTTASVVAAPATTRIAPSGRRAVWWYSRISSTVAVLTTSASPMPGSWNGCVFGYTRERHTRSTTARVSRSSRSSCASVCPRTKSRSSAVSAGVSSVSDIRPSSAGRSSPRHCAPNTAACEPTSSRATAPSASMASAQTLALFCLVPRSIVCAVSRATPGRPTGSNHCPASTVRMTDVVRRSAIGATAMRMPFGSLRRSTRFNPRPPA